MNATIWKIALTTTKYKCELPIGSRPLSVQVKDGKPYVWVLVDPDEKQTETHWFSVQVTGGFFNTDDAGEYIGTFQDDWFVGHVFDQKRQHALEVQNG